MLHISISGVSCGRNQLGDEIKSFNAQVVDFALHQRLSMADRSSHDADKFQKAHAQSTAKSISRSYTVGLPLSLVDAKSIRLARRSPC